MRSVVHRKGKGKEIMLMLGGMKDEEESIVPLAISSLPASLFFIVFPIIQPRERESTWLSFLPAVAKLPLFHLGGSGDRLLLLQRLVLPRLVPTTMTTTGKVSQCAHCLLLLLLDRSHK